MRGGRGVYVGAASPVGVWGFPVLAGGLNPTAGHVSFAGAMRSSTVAWRFPVCWCGRFWEEWYEFVLSYTASTPLGPKSFQVVVYPGVTTV